MHIPKVVITVSSTNGSTNNRTKVFISLNYARTQSPTDVRNSFRERFPDRNPPVTSTILKGAKKYWILGTNLNLNKNGIPTKYACNDFHRRVRFAEWFNVRSQREKYLDRFFIGDEVGTYEFRLLHIANPMHEIPFNYVNAPLGSVIAKSRKFKLSVDFKGLRILKESRTHGIDLFEVESQSFVAINWLFGFVHLSLLLRAKNVA